MTQTLTIALTETEMTLLKKQAALDCRRPQEQARYLLRSVLLNEHLPEKNNRYDTLPLTAGVTAVAA